MNKTEKLLQTFGEECRKTSGASFTITMDVNLYWKIVFINKTDGKVFMNKSIEIVINEAMEYLKDNRSELEISKKYTLYGNKN